MQQDIPAVVVMGVTACGKSTVADAIARAVGGTHIEGDHFHSADNIARMRAGVPLSDADRAAWLTLLGEMLALAVAAGQRPVLSCSALKRSYRDILRAAVPGLGFIFLQIERGEVERRVARRRHHFMSAELVGSQFDTLENPAGEPDVLVVEATLPVEQISRQARDWWHARGDPFTVPMPGAHDD